MKSKKNMILEEIEVQFICAEIILALQDLHA